MIRHTGGLAIGATSTRSRSRPRAIRNASGTGLIPNWLPSGPIRRTSRALMRSLTRCWSLFGGAMADHSCAMGTPLLDGLVARREVIGGADQPARRWAVIVMDPD